jgi:hypothetical protein
MEILRFLFYAFLLYLGFKLIFDFIIPVYKTTTRVRKSFKEMQERMNRHTEQYNQQQGSKNFAKQSFGNSNANAGDYIDFEEVKD